ncbi:hypothetical protein RHMOL_Rhmol11G0028500 [Rhododendron molle]|uniref:Uncharacterized protein n=1 Tax=Rhododendron molle TaxID=49168 RepID=A0ACC0LPB0_RHOML|nr:hypothetical protein RHMOL_Rhmol11G0028500 [Rhododendron molle]
MLWLAVMPLASEKNKHGFRTRYHVGQLDQLSSIRSGDAQEVDETYQVTHLKGKVQEQAEKIQEQAEGIEVANNKIDELVEAKEKQRTLASVMAFLKHQGFTG